MASPRFGHPHSPNLSDTASYPDISLSMKMCGQRKAGRTEWASPAFCTLSMIPCDSSPVARHYRAKNEATEEERASDMGIPCNPNLTINPCNPNPNLTLTQIAKVIWEGRGCPYHYRVLGMGMPKTRGCPYHCNSGLSSTQTEALAHRKNTIVLQAILTQRFVTFGKCRHTMRSVAWRH